jgi:hypothetical protein
LIIAEPLNARRRPIFEADTTNPVPASPSAPLVLCNALSALHMRSAASYSRGVISRGGSIFGAMQACSEDGARQRRRRDQDILSDRADQPVHISVLPRRPRRDRSVANAHGPDAPDEGSARRAVAVADQVAWRLVPAAGFSWPRQAIINCAALFVASWRQCILQPLRTETAFKLST